MSELSLPIRYRATHQVFGGGFSDVEIYIDEHLDRRVAIKKIRDVSDAGRLNDEVSALLNVRSNHVVQVFDVVRQGSSFAIIEEYVDGHDFLTDGPYRHDFYQFLLHIWQLAVGISDIHQCSLIHRDIKPNNVIVDGNGVVKIIDFGLSRYQSLNAMTQGFVGTFGFAAPELFASGWIAFTSAVDIFAFGATALFIGSGSLPPELNRQGAPVPLVSDCFSGFSFVVHDEIKDLLRMCLEIDPSRRPSADHVRLTIEKHLLRDRHQALSVSKSKSYQLNSNNRQIRWSYGDVGSFTVIYDSLSFVITEASGEVFINNSPLTAPLTMTGSCVIAIGNNLRRSNERGFITFDVSHPEVVV